MFFFLSKSQITLEISLTQRSKMHIYVLLASTLRNHNHVTKCILNDLSFRTYFVVKERK